MVVPETVLVSILEPLWSVQTFEARIRSNVEAFPILLTRLPNISELSVLATNDYGKKIAGDTYFDKVVSAIIDGLVKNGVQLKILNMTFEPYWNASKNVSRDTVENFIQMLKTSGMMLQLRIISSNYCVFNESSLIEIIAAIREFTSIMILRIDCCLHYGGELSRFAIQQGQPLEENQEINKSEQSASLMLTLSYIDQECNELVQLDNSTEAFCELWKILHTLPDLNQIDIPRPSSQNIPCDLEPLRSPLVDDPRVFGVRKFWRAKRVRETERERGPLDK
eukprot:XP_011677659.1 PREDICTED: uncharacterized protein LOC100892100 [Strongylocentrotus purpuratus]